MKRKRWKTKHEHEWTRVIHNEYTASRVCWKCGQFVIGGFVRGAVHKVEVTLEMRDVRVY